MASQPIMESVMKTEGAFAAAAALLAVITVSIGTAQARSAWYGPGSGPISPYSNYKGFAQVPRQPASAPRRPQQPVSSQGHCVPNVGLVGRNGVCVD
jgi:hypothetical protein